MTSQRRLHSALLAATLAIAGCAHTTPASPSQPARPAEQRAPSPVAGFKNVPPHMFDTQALSRPVQLSDEVRGRLARRGPVSGMYKVCVNTDGSVAAVSTLEALPTDDDSVVASLEQWQFRPQPMGICSLLRLDFDFKTPPPPPKR